MKKQLLAIAVLGALAAPAFAADSNVTLYGRLEMGYEFFDNGDTAALKGVTTQRVEGYASRIGFKGEEDLGGGLKAVFQIETKVNPDNAAQTSFADRNSYVGLKGDFGTLLIGRHDTPFKQLNKNVDIMWGNAEQTEVITNGKASGISLHTRQDNILHYTSPKFSDITLRASFAPDEAKTGSTNKRRLSVSGEFDNGTFNVGLGYENQADQVAAGKDRQGLKLVGGFKLGDTTFGAAYSQLENETVKEVDTFALAVSHKIGAVTLKGAWAKASENDIGSNTQDGVDMYGLEVDYALSKRTAVYGLFTQIKNETKASAGFANGTSGGAPIGAGADPRIVSVGIRHNF